MEDVRHNYEEFAKFVKAAPFAIDEGYIDDLRDAGSVRLRRQPRSMLEIVEEIGQGFFVKDWKKKCKRSALIAQINNMCNRGFDVVDSDLLEINYVLLGTFISKFDKDELIANWREAQANGCLKSYFGIHDVFHIAEGINTNYRYKYSDDYFEYIRSFPLEQRVIWYRTYLVLVSDEIQIKHNSFEDPRYFVGVADRQFAEYEEIINSIQREEGEYLYFLGDGLGTGSMICLKNGIDYLSAEQNRIGRMAIQIGLITTVAFKPTQMKNGILVLMNVEEYLNDDEVKYYESFFEKIVVVAESRKSRIGVPMAGTSDKVFSKNVFFRSKPKIKKMARVDDYLMARSPVDPVDRKSELYAREAKIPIEEGGFPISFDNVGGAFNIRTRHYPGNMTMARKGDIKIHKNVKFKYESEGQVVSTESEVFKYYPDDPKSASTLRRGMYREEKDLIVAVLPRPRQIRRYEDGNGIIFPIYYLNSRMVGDKFESYFSKVNVGVPNVVAGEDYVVRDDG
jgi:hypothetical protein